MGYGIGINCRRCCGHQLNFDDGFNSSTQLCNECDSIVSFDGNSTSIESFDIEVITDYLTDYLEHNYITNDERHLFSELGLSIAKYFKECV